MHIAEAFAHMDERDRAPHRDRAQPGTDHGELIANETTRVVEAMQAYVQGGAEAVGRLAQRIEEHAQLFITQDHNITEHVREAVEEQTRSSPGCSRWSTRRSGCTAASRRTCGPASST